MLKQICLLDEIQIVAGERYFLVGHRTALLISLPVDTQGT